MGCVIGEVRDKGLMPAEVEVEVRLDGLDLDM